MCASRLERLLVAATLAVAVAVGGQRAAADIFCVIGSRPALVRQHVARTVDGPAAASLLRRLTPTRGSCTTCHLAPGPESLLQPNTPALWSFTAYGQALTILRPGLPPGGLGLGDDVATVAEHPRAVWANEESGQGPTGGR